MTNSDCSWRWLFQSILSTHICVGGGTESACNVSTLYIILLIFDQEHIFEKLFLDYCFLFLFFLFCLSWHQGWLRWPSCLPEERRVGLGGCDVMGFLQLSEHAQCVHPRVQVLVLDGHKDGKLNKYVTLKKISLSHSEISLSHSEINKNKKRTSRVFPPYFLKIRIRSTQEFKLD